MLTRVRELFRPKADDSEFMTDTNAVMLHGARPLAHWILWSTLAFLLVALIWASRAELDEVTLGQGHVIPSSKVQVVQNLEGGIIAEILVEPGQIVRKGQPLMRIDDTRFSSSYQESAAKDDALRARIARLEAEAAHREFVPPLDLQRDKAELVVHEREVFDSRRRDLRAGLAVLERQLEQRTQELAEMQARAAQLAHSYDLVQQELAITRQAADQNVFPKVQLIRLERQANDLKGELDAAHLSMPRLQAALGEVRRKAEQMTAEFQAAASRELSEARAEQSIVSASKVALEDRLARTTVRAPLSGTIKQVKVNTIGGVVQPGMDLVEIVPLEDSLLVEARVRPADIAFLRPGLEAMVKLTAYDFSIYGGLEGTVEHISADAIIDERPGVRPESYYLVRVRTSRGGRGAGDKHLRIIPGMQATVDIRTGHKTVLQYLLKPVLRAKQTALRER
ncbi:MAG TPA: HlyD family type I secretion periplasmic adaptor subunit [Steroidobacter sp.]|uniref:HlyD family type I secretion periplasmic adaptor subunit n=1 Tax=Steroidobacter sp. TaxID=1978227 RepID=UPI002EDB5FD2